VIAPLLVLTLLGCPPKRAQGDDPPLVIVVPVAPADPVGEVIGPGPWTDPAGLLGLVIPEEWAGLAGPPAGSLVLTLSHPSGVQVQLWEFAGSGQIGPRPRPGCEWMFSDEGRHRVVPALAPAITGTCLSDDPHGPVVQGWYGRVRGREVHVEVVYPAGRVIEGRAVVEPVLSALYVVGAAPVPAPTPVPVPL